MNARRWIALAIFAATATAASYGLTRKSGATIAPPPTIQAAKSPAENLWPGFAIYLAGGAATTAELNRKPLADVALSPLPMMTENDVEFYDWDLQTVRLKFGNFSALPGAYAPYGPKEDAFVGGKTFVVVAGGERIYMGGLWKSDSSQPADFPIINLNALMRIPPPFRGGRDRIWPGLQFRIETTGLDQTPRELDPRKDVRIYAALKKAGILANSGKAANG